jgi:hypothetical protein
MCTVRALPAEQRGWGEADGWAAATVSGRGDVDGRGPSGSASGREGRVGRPEKKKGWSSPDEQ